MWQSLGLDRSTLHQVISDSFLVPYLKWGEDGRRDDDEEPEVHVEELTDHVGHVGREDQQEQTERHGSEVFPQTPGESTDDRRETNDRQLERWRLQFHKRLYCLNRKKNVLLVSGGSQGQDYRVCYLQHGLQDWGDDDEEDNGEEEGSVDDLQLDEASLDSQDQQRDAFSHPPATTEHKHYRTRSFFKNISGKKKIKNKEPHLWPVHGVVVHEGSVALQVELAECENAQSDEGDGEDQTQQRVRRTATLCNTGRERV